MQAIDKGGVELCTFQLDGSGSCEKTELFPALCDDLDEVIVFLLLRFQTGERQPLLVPLPL